jgi:hypothetical protein
MSVSTARSTVARLQKEIADLRVKDAAEAKKEASLTEKMVKASNAARTSKSASTIASKLTEASRASSDIASVQNKRADLSKTLAVKTAELTRAQTALDKAQEADRKKIAADQKKADDARARQLKRLEDQLAAQRRAALAAPVAVAEAPAEAAAAALLPEYDVFISHASEDKDGFVRRSRKSWSRRASGRSMTRCRLLGATACGAGSTRGWPGRASAS